MVRALEARQRQLSDEYMRAARAFGHFETLRARLESIAREHDAVVAELAKIREDAEFADVFGPASPSSRSTP